MECKFHVGQKVVCVTIANNAEDHKRHSDHLGLGIKFPEIGKIYTIREIAPHPSGVIGVRLHELCNPVLAYRNRTNELWFAAQHFRPLEERKTDISIFKAMLTPKTEQVQA